MAGSLRRVFLSPAAWSRRLGGHRCGDLAGPPDPGQVTSKSRPSRRGEAARTCQTWIVPGDLRPEMTGDSRLHFSVLGSFRVDRDSVQVDLGPRLQRMLLAILVVEAGHVVPVDRLIDLLWREEPPAAAIASVQAYISQLRRVLEPGRPARAPARVLVTQNPGTCCAPGMTRWTRCGSGRWRGGRMVTWRAASPRPRPRAWRRRWRCGGVIRWPSSPTSRGRWPRWPGSPRRTTLPSRTGLRRGWRWAGTRGRRPSWRRWWRRGRCGSGAGGS